jgi:DNA-3-methyladenine glycosylase II
MTMGPRITSATLRVALDELGARDSHLARAYRAVGAPPLRSRPPGFDSLLRIICAQQISVAAAGAILGRLDAAVDTLTPGAFLALDDTALRDIGLSRRKVDYGRGLASDILDGRLDLDGLRRLDDEAAIGELIKARGIGRWTAEVYLLFALRRPDIWPVDDLAMVVALGRLRGEPERLSRAEMIAIGESWRPWRSAAARLLWHYYRRAPV